MTILNLSRVVTDSAFPIHASTQGNCQHILKKFTDVGFVWHQD